MKKRSFFVTVVTIMLALSIVGCSSSASGGATGTKEKKVSKLNWRITSSFPAGHSMNEPLHQLAKELKARSNGAINVSIEEGTLGQPTEAWDMTKDNTVQMTYTGEAYNTSRMPITNMVALPFELADPKTTVKVLKKWEQDGYLSELTNNFKVLGYVPLVPSHFFFRKNEVTKMDDLKGLKVRTPGSTQAELLKALGATGVTMSGTDVYMGLDRGVIDGTLTGIDNIFDRKLYETAHDALRLPLYESVFVLLMNKQTWESLTPELQKVVSDVSSKVVAKEVDKVESEDNQLWKKLEATSGMTVYTLSNEEAKKWREAARNVADNYADTIDKQGYPGKAALKDMREITGNK